MNEAAGQLSQSCDSAKTQNGLISRGRDVEDTTTCGQNLDRKIERLQTELARLVAARSEMETSGLANIKIGTLRDAMQY